MRVLFLLVCLFVGESRADALLNEARVLLLVDWAQSREIARQDYYIELNPVLGARPSQADVNRYFATALLSTFLIDKLPNKHRQRALFVFVGVERWAVGNNLNLGIRVRF